MIQLFALLSVFTAPPNAAAIAATPQDGAFDRAIRALQSQQSGSFTVEFLAKQKGGTSKGSYDVQFIRPDRLSVRTRVQAVDRTFTVIGSELYGIDHHAREYLSANVGDKGAAPQRMASAVPIDEPVLIVVDPEEGAKFLTSYKGLEGWTAKPTATGLSLSGKSSNGVFKIAFDNLSRVTLVVVSSPAGSIQWTYHYGNAPQNLAFNKPAGMKQVDGFVDNAAEQMPKFSDKDARTATLAAFKAYRRLDSIAYSVYGMEGPVRVWKSGRHVRQHSPTGEWSWDGKKLQVMTFKDRTFRMADVPTWAQVDETVAKLGLGLDPTLRVLGQRQSPMAALVGPDLKARSIGSVKVAGAPCKIVEYAAPGIQITLTIRLDNGMIVSSSSVNKDAHGKAMAASDRRFEYQSVGKPLGASVFRLIPAPGMRQGTLDVAPPHKFSEPSRGQDSP